MRRYETIWHQIKLAEPTQWVRVTVSTPDQIQTIINMVQLEKSRANSHRKHLDLPLFGRLEIDRDSEQKWVKFRLKNSGHQL